MSIPGNRGFSGIGSNFTPGPPAAQPSIDSITGSPNPVTEGNNVTWTVSTTNIPDGTVLDWQTTSAADTNPDFGTVTINSNTGTFQYTAVDDGVTEGNENKTVIVYGTVSGVSLNVTSSPVTFQDPAAGTVNSVTGPASVNEGSSATFTVSTSNIPDGSTLGWSVVFGGNANPQAVIGDFSSTSGSFTVTSNAGSFSVPIVADTTTEGPEDFRALANYSASGSSATSGYVVINDTSTSPPGAVLIVTGPASVNEGDVAGIIITGTSPAAATAGFYTLNWSVNNVTTASGDFSSTSGTVQVYSDGPSGNLSGAFNIGTIADSTTEGSETFTVTVSGNIAGTVMSDTSSSITINDTSTTPATPAINTVTGPSSVNEGASASISVSTSNIPDGTTLNWAVNNGTSDNTDFDSTSGTVTINSNAGSFSVPIADDHFTEGSETFTVTVSGTVSSTPVSGTSGSITINDTSLTPSVDSVTGPASVNEGSSATINVTTTGIGDGVTLNWAVNNVSTQNADFSQTSGTFQINSNAGSFSVPIVADSLTEGSQTFTVTVSGGPYGVSVSGTSGSITINDTSQGGPTYAISAPASIDEGSAGTVNVTTTNVANGTTLYWTVATSGGGDFATTSGNVTINSNAASFTVTPLADNSTEGSETATVRLLTGSVIGTVVATDTFTINDTSQQTATYSVNAPTLDEQGYYSSPSDQAITVSTTGVPDGTTLYWNITPTAEFDTTSGSFTINSNSGTINVRATRDFITEGTDSYTINVRTGSTTGTIVATNTGSISDTAQAVMFNDVSGVGIPIFQVYNAAGTSTYQYTWDDTFIGSTTASSISDGTYTYTRGAVANTISDKNGTNTWYVISRS